MAVIIGTDGDDKYPNQLNGTEAADEIFGLAGADELIGFGGDDVLEGGAGADELFGSNGFDLASYKGSAAGVTVLLGRFYANGGDAAGDHLYSIEGVAGSAFSDTIYGDDGRNVLRGEGSSDFLRGEGGDDLLAGGDGGDYLDSGTGADELRGGSGADAAFYGNSAQAVQVDLAANTGSGGDAAGDRFFSIENLVGSYHNDRLAGNGGANALDGANGADVLEGRGGADRFVYDRTGDSLPTAPDRILDFSRAQADRVDLLGIDANEQVTGDQAFQFVGQAKFTGAGQLRFFQQDGDTFVEANTTDATGGAELTIRIDPLVAFQATDFVL